MIYARLSRKTDGNVMNIGDQVARCLEHAASRGWDVVEVIEDLGESAYDRDAADDRPGFGKLIDMVRTGQVDVVLAWRPDRLWRDPIESTTFLRDCTRAGVGIVATVLEGDRDPANPGDEMVSTMVAAVGRYESAAKSARLRAKARQLAEAGRPPGGATPFGYDRERNLVPAQASIVREAAVRVLAGESLRSVARSLNDRGVRTARGGEWDNGNLGRLLTRPHIAGLRQHQGKIIGPATWDPIIDMDTWTALQRLIRDPARRLNTHTRPYLFTGGIARCGVCTGPLIARPSSGSIRRYCCPSTTDLPAGCGKIQRNADQVETEVLGRLWTLITAGELPIMPAPTPGVSIDEVNALDARLTELSRDFYVHELITRAEYLAARAPLAAAAEAARARLAGGPSVPTLPPAGEWQARWGSYEHGQRRAILTSVINTVTILPAVRGRNQFDPTKIEVDWRGALHLPSASSK